MCPRWILHVALPLAALAAACGDSAPQAAATATFVGAATCARCHPAAQAGWLHSHHELAMQPATAGTVLGDFADATFVKDGVTTTFTHRDAGYQVRTEAADGSLQDFEVTHVFGVAPLQQYLLQFPGGRLQALDIAWDARPRGQGGQRWFALHPGDRVRAGDPLHWTGPNLNWNSMCAECHSTDLRKGYDGERDVFRTTFAEIDVACEACHGPGSAHVEWAERAAGAGRSAANGLPVTLPARGTFTFAPGAVTATRADGSSGAGGAEVEVCGRCHARRTPVVDYEHGRPLLDTHLVALLDEGLYFADGQIRDEVYEYGSFVQSRMYHAGVTCSDCHDPHSLHLRANGNALCARCHSAGHFDQPAHHHHGPGSAGAACVDCHMPVRHYMVVDPRRDHSLRVPRPDLAARYGLPDACTNCHRDRDARWAADAVASWRRASGSPEPAEHWTAALHAGRQRVPAAVPLLLAAANRSDWPPIVRGTALSLLQRQDGDEVRTGLRAGARSAAPLVRLGAVEGAREQPLAARMELLAPLLRDPVRAVRLQAAAALADVPETELGAGDQQALARGLAEYEAMQLQHGDRDWAHANRGYLLQQRGRPEAAAAAYRLALRRDRGSVRAATNLADLYREQGRDDQGEAVLRAALAVAWEQAPLQHALGLLLVRRGDRQGGLELLAAATRNQPGNARFAFVHGVALVEDGQVDAGLATVQRAHELQPDDAELLLGLATLTRAHRSAAAALPWAQQLADLRPADPAAQQLLAELRAAARQGR